jgi:hypothetical protein
MWAQAVILTRRENLIPEDGFVSMLESDIHFVLSYGENPHEPDAVTA